MFSTRRVALNVTTASVQLRVLNNSVYLSAGLKLRGLASPTLLIPAVGGDYFPMRFQLSLFLPGAQIGNCVDPRATYGVTVARYREILLPWKEGGGLSQARTAGLRNQTVQIQTHRRGRPTA
jgi:hypothetical protein